MSLSFSYETHNFLLSPRKPQSQPHPWLAPGSHQKIYIYKKKPFSTPTKTHYHPPTTFSTPTKTHHPNLNPIKTVVKAPPIPTKSNPQNPPNHAIIAKPSPCLITTIANQKPLNLNEEHMSFRTEAAWWKGKGDDAWVVRENQRTRGRVWESEREWWKWAVSKEREN